MNIDRLIKKEVIISIITVLLVGMGFVGFSYAIFKVETEGGTITTTYDDISIELCDDINCSDIASNLGKIIGTTDNVSFSSNIYPMSDSEGVMQTPYTFVIRNTGTTKFRVDLKLTFDLTMSSSDNNKSYFNQIAYAYRIDTDGQIKINRLESSEVKLNTETFVEPNSYVVVNFWIWGSEKLSNDFINSEIRANLAVSGALIPNDYSSIYSNKYTITYNLNGGSFGSIIPLYENDINSEYTLPKPSKNGYLFAGWTTLTNSVPQRNVTIPYGNIADLSYTANWVLDSEFYCTLIASGTTKNGFFNSNVEIYMIFSDSNVQLTEYGIGTSRNTDNKRTSLILTEDADNVTFYGYAKTNLDVISECSIVINRDATPPLCSISSSGTTLTLSGSDNLGNIQVSWTSKDTGFADNNLRSTGTRTKNTYKGWVKDAAGNIGACEYRCGSWSGVKTSTCLTSGTISDGITSYVDTTGSGCCAWEGSNYRCKFAYRRENSRTCQSVNVSP